MGDGRCSDHSYNDQYPLAYQSHFYEFEYLEGEKQGQIVSFMAANKVTWSAIDYFG